MARERITLEDFRSRLTAQSVARKDLAMICPVCRTVQSMQSLILAGVSEADVEGVAGFACVGRFTNAGEHKQGDPPGKGCNWTLGGLFRIHELEVLGPDGDPRPFFAVATAEQAQALAAENAPQHTAEDASGRGE